MVMKRKTKVGLAITALLLVAGIAILVFSLRKKTVRYEAVVLENDRPLAVYVTAGPYTDAGLYYVSLAKNASISNAEGALSIEELLPGQTLEITAEQKDLVLAIYPPGMDATRIRVTGVADEKEFERMLAEYNAFRTMTIPVYYVENGQIQATELPVIQTPKEKFEVWKKYNNVPGEVTLIDCRFEDNGTESSYIQDGHPVATYTRGDVTKLTVEVNDAMRAVLAQSPDRDLLMQTLAKTLSSPADISEGTEIILIADKEVIYRSAK